MIAGSQAGMLTVVDAELTSRFPEHPLANAVPGRPVVFRFDDSKYVRHPSPCALPLPDMLSTSQMRPQPGIGDTSERLRTLRPRL